jgi:hypothetical protein
VNKRALAAGQPQEPGGVLAQTSPEPGKSGCPACLNVEEVHALGVEGQGQRHRASRRHQPRKPLVINVLVLAKRTTLVSELRWKAQRGLLACD